MVGVGRAPIFERGLRRIDGPGGKHAQSIWQDVRLAGRHRQFSPIHSEQLTQGVPKEQLFSVIERSQNTSPHSETRPRSSRWGRGRYEEYETRAGVCGETHRFLPYQDVCRGGTKRRSVVGNEYHVQVAGWQDQGNSDQKCIKPYTPVLQTAQN